MKSNWPHALKRLIQFIINISVFMVAILMVITLFGLTNAIIKISTWGLLTRALFMVGLLFLLVRVTIYLGTTDQSRPLFSLIEKIHRKKSAHRKTVKKRHIHLTKTQENYISSWNLFKGFLFLGMVGMIFFPELPQTYIVPLVLSFIYELTAWHYDWRIRNGIYIR